MKNKQARWGFITQTGTKQEKIMLPNIYTGGLYHGGEYREILQLQCDCGHQWEVYEDEFPGKWTVRNCGREEECVYARNKLTSPPAGRRPTTRGIPTQVYMPMQMFYDVSDSATSQGLSFSRATVKLLQIAFQAMRNMERVTLESKQPGGAPQVGLTLTSGIKELAEDAVAVPEPELLTPVTEEPTDW